MARVNSYDAIVVGAGPGGSTTAHRLANAGARVLLLDRASFPRDKPCGGGVTLRAAAQIPVSIDPVVEQVISTTELAFRYKRMFPRGTGGPLVYMTQRVRLDHFLVEQAVKAGAELREGVKVTGVETDGRGATVTAGTERLTAEAVVGADGVNGVAARALGLGGNKTIGVALEANVPYTKIDRERWRGRILLELGAVPGGYAWLFPKGEHVNLGVGSWAGEAPRLRTHLARLCEAVGVRMEDLEATRGYRLPCRTADSILSRGRGLVVGDAAGLVDPLTGDGMYEAFFSGRCASEAIGRLLAGETETLDAYSPDVTRRLATHLWAAWSLKAALDRFPRTSFALAKSHAVWPVVEKLITGEISDISTVRGIARPPLKAIELMARFAGNPGHAYLPA
jgi:geranylgeranyl reductase family protein